MPCFLQCHFLSLIRWHALKWTGNGKFLLVSFLMHSMSKIQVTILTRCWLRGKTFFQKEKSLARGQGKTLCLCPLFFLCSLARRAPIRLWANIMGREIPPSLVSEPLSIFPFPLGGKVILFLIMLYLFYLDRWPTLNIFV